MLYAAGVSYDTVGPDIDESAVKARFFDGAAIASQLAAAKALSVTFDDDWVIGSDSVVSAGGRLFDKPRDRAEARAHLANLRGKRHELLTAAAVARNGAVLWRLIERPFLFMRPFSDEFLDAYLAAIGDSALASVGAYQLEGLGAQLFARIEGDYFSVLGLPLLPLLDFLRGHGVVMR